MQPHDWGNNCSLIGGTQTGSNAKLNLKGVLSILDINTLLILTFISD